jgi:hypothetical protein
VLLKRVSVNATFRCLWREAGAFDKNRRVSAPPSQDGQFPLPQSIMRLRLIIDRNGLPLTPVVWDILPDLTIAQLLEQVSEVIPLEFGDWGLEDYAVELAGQSGLNFEFVHYQQVGRVMRDEDEVMCVIPLVNVSHCL